MVDELLREEWKCVEQEALAEDFDAVVAFQTVTESRNVAKDQPTSVVDFIALFSCRVFAFLRCFEIPKMKSPIGELQSGDGADELTNYCNSSGMSLRLQ